MNAEKEKTRKLNAFASDIEARLAAINKDDFSGGEKVLRTEGVVAKALPLEDLTRDLESILGAQRVSAFFGSSRSSLLGVLINLVLQNYTVQDRARVALKMPSFLQRLEQVAVAVDQGKIDYCIRFRLVNFSIDKEITLGDSILLHTLTPEELRQTYPINRQFTPVSPLIEQHWFNHRVEAVIHCRGTLSDLQQDFGVQGIDALERSITHAFFLSAILKESTPYATHVAMDSPIEHSCVHLRRVRGFVFEVT